MRPTVDTSHRPTFSQIAKIIDPECRFPWLTRFLEWWALSQASENWYEPQMPTRTSIAANLKSVAKNPARFATLSSEKPVLREIFKFGSDFDPRTKNPQYIAEFALQALKGFSSASGKMKAGRGRVRACQPFPPRILCAARIAVIWEFVRGKRPGPRNPGACKAADMYLQVTHGSVVRRGEHPVAGWRRPFSQIWQINAGKLLLMRRDLEQAQERGGPPFYLGVEEDRNRLPASTLKNNRKGPILVHPAHG